MLIMLLYGLTSLSLILLLNNGLSTACPTGYRYSLNGTCYFFSHDVESWTGALMSCSILEGHLVEIESSEEFEYLRNTATAVSVDDGIWIGLTNKRLGYEWEWATSERVLGNKTDLWTRLWAPGEPDSFGGHGDESCAMMDWANNHGYRVADVKCERLQRYVCEKTSSQFTVPFG